MYNFNEHVHDVNNYLFFRGRFLHALHSSFISPDFISLQIRFGVPTPRCATFFSRYVSCSSSYIIANIILHNTNNLLDFSPGSFDINQIIIYKLQNSAIFGSLCHPRLEITFPIVDTKHVFLPVLLC